MKTIRRIFFLLLLSMAMGSYVNSNPGPEVLAQEVSLQGSLGELDVPWEQLQGVRQPITWKTLLVGLLTVLGVVFVISKVVLMPFRVLQRGIQGSKERVALASIKTRYEPGGRHARFLEELHKGDLGDGPELRKLRAELVMLEAELEACTEEDMYLASDIRRRIYEHRARIGRIHAEAAQRMMEDIHADMSLLELDQPTLKRVAGALNAAAKRKRVELEGVRACERKAAGVQEEGEKIRKT